MGGRPKQRKYFTFLLYFKPILYKKVSIIQIHTHFELGTMKDTFRTILGIRKDRKLLPISEQPMVGSNIVRERLRIWLKYPITSEQWAWFVKMGWRTVDLRNDRRRYTSVSDRLLLKLLNAEEHERDRMHQALLDAATARQASTKTNE